ncbi:MAG: hypothetical protein RL325_1615 [Planctomycetota bacterium]|jgi:hypothetical protein
MSGAKRAHAASAAIVLGSLVAWLATGREGFTRWPDARLEASDAPVSKAEQDLLDEIGVGSEQPPESEKIESRFAFGLVPGGPDPKHLLSVATGCALACAISGTAIVARRLKGRSS